MYKVKAKMFGVASVSCTQTLNMYPGAHTPLPRVYYKGAWSSGKTLDCRPWDCEFDPPLSQLK